MKRKIEETEETKKFAKLELLKINVGGKVFHFTRDTVYKKDNGEDEENLLQKIFSEDNKFECTKDENGIIFLERSYILFDTIYNYIVSDYNIDIILDVFKDERKSLIIKELNFYGFKNLATYISNDYHVSKDNSYDFVYKQIISDTTYQYPNPPDTISVSIINDLNHIVEFIKRNNIVTTSGKVPEKLNIDDYTFENKSEIHRHEKISFKSVVEIFGNKGEILDLIMAYQIKHEENNFIELKISSRHCSTTIKKREVKTSNYFSIGIEKFEENKFSSEGYSSNFERYMKEINWVCLNFCANLNDDDNLLNNKISSDYFTCVDNMTNWVDKKSSYAYDKKDIIVGVRYYKNEISFYLNKELAFKRELKTDKKLRFRVLARGNIKITSIKYPEI